ncbi:MAG: hypothetical protein ACJ8GK_05555, partial [Luteimonas sp.]
PSTLTLAEAIAHSNLRKVSTNVVIAYDALGNVIGVKLEKPTGSATLDKAILAWAALVKINRDKAGFASIPIELASSE